MAGLIASNISKEDPLSSISGYDPSKIDIDPETETVEGRIAGITAKNAPLQQLARTRSKQEMLGKGLLSSSIAVGAGEKAVLESALPIASQDVSNLLSVKQANQLAANQASQFTAGATNVGAAQQLAGEQQLGIIGAQTEAAKELNAQQNAARLEEQRVGFQNELDLAIKSGDITAQRDANLQLYNIESLNTQYENSAKMTELQNEYQTTTQELGFEQQKTLDELRNTYQQTLNGSTSAVNLYGTTMQALSAIGSNPNLSAAQRQAGIDQQIDMLIAGLELVDATDGVDLTITNFADTSIAGSAEPEVETKQLYTRQGWVTQEKIDGEWVTV